MNIDKLFTLNSSQLDEYLEMKVEAIIASVSPEKRKRLRAVHNRARLAVQSAKNPTQAMLMTFDLMQESMAELNQKLQEYVGKAEPLPANTQSTILTFPEAVPDT